MVSHSRGGKTAGVPARSSKSDVADAGGRAAVKRAKAPAAVAGAPAAKKTASTTRGKAAGAAKAASPARKAAPATRATAAARKSAPAVKRAAAAAAGAMRKPATKAATKAARPAKAAAAKPKADPVARLREQVIEGLERIKARDIREIDVRGRASFADLLVVASGTSTTHVRSIADEVIKHAKRVGTMPLGVEGAREAEWVLVDLGDIVVHVMLPRVREFYALERLWTVGAEEPAAAMPA
jgi:ribosome-associated protein